MVMTNLNSNPGILVKFVLSLLLSEGSMLIFFLYFCKNLIRVSHNNVQF